MDSSSNGGSPISKRDPNDEHALALQSSLRHELDRAYAKQLVIETAVELVGKVTVHGARAFRRIKDEVDRIDDGHEFYGALLKKAGEKIQLVVDRGNNAIIGVREADREADEE